MIEAAPTFTPCYAAHTSKDIACVECDVRSAHVDELLTTAQHQLRSLCVQADAISDSIDALEPMPRLRVLAVAKGT